MPCRRTHLIERQCCAILRKTRVLGAKHLDVHLVEYHSLTWPVKLSCWLVPCPVTHACQRCRSHLGWDEVHGGWNGRVRRRGRQAAGPPRPPLVAHSLSRPDLLTHSHRVCISAAVRAAAVWFGARLLELDDGSACSVLGAQSQALVLAATSATAWQTWQ